jgi:hypothetical protein
MISAHLILAEENTVTGLECNGDIGQSEILNNISAYSNYRKRCRRWVRPGWVILTIFLAHRDYCGFHDIF